MVSYVDIETIKPAAYNPRKITKEQQQELCKSIRRFGLIVPILVNRKDNVIIAGHQRTKATRLVGIQTVPVQYVESINLGDEIKFNQIHNATESGTVKVRFDGDAEKGKFSKKDAANAWRAVEFLDADNFSANYRSGKWYFQHYHSKEQIKKSLEESGFEIVKLDWEKYGSSWQCEAVKTRELPLQRYIDAIDFEFDLPLPNGRSYKRNGDVKRALGFE